MGQTHILGQMDNLRGTRQMHALNVRGFMEQIVPITPLCTPIPQRSFSLRMLIPGSHLCKTIPSTSSYHKPVRLPAVPFPQNTSVPTIHAAQLETLRLLCNEAAPHKNTPAAARPPSHRLRGRRLPPDHRPDSKRRGTNGSRLK